MTVIYGGFMGNELETDLVAAYKLACEQRTDALTHLGAIDRMLLEHNYEKLLKGDLLLLMGSIENLVGQAVYGDRWQDELQRRQDARV